MALVRSPDSCGGSRLITVTLNFTFISVEFKDFFSSHNIKGVLLNKYLAVLYLKAYLIMYEIIRLIWYCIQNSTCCFEMCLVGKQNGGHIAIYSFEKNSYSEWSSVTPINSITQTLQLILKYWMNVKPEIKSFIILDVFLSKSLFTFFLVYSISLHSKMTSNYSYRVHPLKLMVCGEGH